MDVKKDIAVTKALWREDSAEPIIERDCIFRYIREQSEHFNNHGKNSAIYGITTFLCYIS